MATDAIVIISPSDRALEAGQPRRFGSYAIADYWALTKPEINFLIAIAVFAGFDVSDSARSGAFPFLLLIHTLFGTLLVASGTGALNQYIERRFDAQMRRTAKRPLAAGRIEPSHALWFGILLSVAGTVYLALAANILASMLAVLTLTSYLFLYTPLKRKTPLCTMVGAIPGAMPPLIGAAAAAGRLSAQAWALYAVLFLWQFPHFMAIAWMYREDYDRAGYRVLPGGEPRTRFVILQTILPLIGLVAICLVAGLGRHGVFYVSGGLLLSLGYLYYGAEFASHRSGVAARRLLFASILYLPLQFVLMTLFRR